MIEDDGWRAIITFENGDVLEFAENPDGTNKSITIQEIYQMWPQYRMPEVVRTTLGELTSRGWVGVDTPIWYWTQIND